ncbi:MAG TPA: helix-turn-helix domain-containing protein [Pseudomonas sp.]|uniref:MarR family transcriptional regulator n=1 Tax=Pseudomonas sp. TaxID=306 RepID=UPI002CBDE802|nr:helix-turn-helix domain-containing protein [Pseudomonas sp.]HSX87816.1 helix-turn-helix domain-containing protein [Pseudomonas sp.]
MPNIEIERYLMEVLGLHVSIAPWPEASELPFYLQDTYEFAAIELLGQRYVLLRARDAEQGASELRKRLDKLVELSGVTGIFVAQEMNSYQRKRLITQHVPFIVPGNQLYLPDLGLDLREYFRTRQLPSDKGISPATQALLISALLNPWRTEVHPAELGERLGYTPMTLSRAVKELVAAGLAEVVGKGRERWLHFKHGPRDTWQRALPLLRSPVGKRLWLWPEPQLFEQARLAGESALAQQSLLSEPAAREFALSAEQWKLMQHKGIQLLPRQEPGAVVVQVWRYSPGIIEGDRLVDPLSLILSLQDVHDERVRQAMDDLQEQLPW